jgi:hypothetical protein
MRQYAYDLGLFVMGKMVLAMALAQKYLARFREISSRVISRSVLHLLENFPQTKICLKQSQTDQKKQPCHHGNTFQRMTDTVWSYI